MDIVDGRTKSCTSYLEEVVGPLCSAAIHLVDGCTGMIQRRRAKVDGLQLKIRDQVDAGYLIAHNPLIFLLE